LGEQGGSSFLLAQMRINCMRRQQKTQSYITLSRGESALRTWRLANSARGESSQEKSAKEAP